MKVDRIEASDIKVEEVGNELRISTDKIQIRVNFVKFALSVY